MQTSAQNADVCITINNSAKQIIDKGWAYIICSAMLPIEKQSKKCSVHLTQNLNNIAHRIN